MEWADIIVEECAQTEDAKSSSTPEINSEGSMWDELNAEDLEDYRFECLYCDFKTLHEELWTAHVNHLHQSPQKQIDQDEERENRDFEKLNTEHVESKLDEEIDLDENKATYFKDVDANINTNDHRESNKDKSGEIDIEKNEDVADAAPHWADIKVEENNEIQDVPIFKPRRLFSCDQCSYMSNRKEHMKNHVLVMHTASEKIEWFNCDKCSYKCKLRKYLTRHVKRKHLKGMQHIQLYYCDQCSYTSDQKNHVKDHILLIHTALEKTEWFHCDKCSFKCNVRGYLTQHVKQKHPKKKLIHCKRCSFRTESEQEFIDHLRVQHSHQWYYCEMSDEVTWFCCPHCTFRTKCRDSVKGHVVRLHTVRQEGQ